MNPGKRKLAIFFSPLLFLLIPLIAMQFTNEVQWDVADFIVASILLLSISVSVTMAQKLKVSTTIKMLLIVVIIGIVGLLWAEMAVGIFGSPIAGS